MPLNFLRTSAGPRCAISMNTPPFGLAWPSRMRYMIERLTMSRVARSPMGS
jgi:hypothetical protein